MREERLKNFLLALQSEAANGGVLQITLFCTCQEA